MTQHIKWSNPEAAGVVAIGEHLSATIEIRLKYNSWTRTISYEALVYLKGKNIPHAISENTVDAAKSQATKYLKTLKRGE